jgi:quercetin dioxygenase-like cupin family protein
MTSIWFLDCLVRDLSPQAGGDAPLAMMEVRSPAGSQPPPHVHHNEDEGFFVLEGAITLFTPDAEVALGPGEFAVGPKGVPHTFRAGDAGARVLTISTPGGFADFVRAMGVPAEREELPVLEGPPDIVRLTEIAARHGIEFVGPPGSLPRRRDAAAVA